ncbi:MAG: hypothetical protein KC493_13760 [Bacteriovoracaceae bacterium]|nr:hypothetical protein [Bacteriovoracaceae bacterium]
MPKQIDVLYNQWKDSKLAHFYIFEAHASVNKKQVFLKKCINDFLVQTLQNQKNISKTQAQGLLTSGHGDILFIRKSDKKSIEYTQKSGDLEPLFKFLTFTNLELKQRFIIVEDAHLISKQLSNKLLKSLEEPSPRTTIIFLADKTNQFLPTILSRAILWKLRDQESELPKFSNRTSVSDSTVNLKNSDSKNAITIKQYLNNEIDLYEVIGKVSKRADYEDCFHIIAECLTNTSEHVGLKSKALEQLKWWNKAKTFHNSPQESLIGLLTALKTV